MSEVGACSDRGQRRGIGGARRAKMMEARLVSVRLAEDCLILTQGPRPSISAALWRRLCAATSSYHLDTHQTSMRLIVAAAAVLCARAQTLRPIIGILSLPNDLPDSFADYTSYFLASCE